jgi:hypothetical protein
MSDADLAHGEDGRPVPCVTFDYAEVEKGLGEHEPDSDLSEFSQEDIDRALKVLTTLLQWVWQMGMKNADGIQIRAILVCWIFLKELRPLQLSDLGKGFGKPKQSFGRWHDNFKKCFPRIRTPHMR